MINFAQVNVRRPPENAPSKREPDKEVAVSSTQPSETGAHEPDTGQPVSASRRPSIVEAVLDNLPVWTVIAAAITLLYLVWATIDVLNVYSGDLPSVVP